MKKSQFPWAITAVLVVAWAGWHVLGVSAAIAVMAVVYRVSLKVHPRIRHTGFRGCGGTGEHKGFFFRWTFRRCPRCASGRIIRYGAGHWGADHIQGEYRRMRAARATAREDHRWR